MNSALKFPQNISKKTLTGLDIPLIWVWNTSILTYRYRVQGLYHKRDLCFGGRLLINTIVYMYALGSMSEAVERRLYL